MAELAQKCQNCEGMPMQVMGLHELWVRAGCPCTRKCRQNRVRKGNGEPRQKRRTLCNIHEKPADSDSDVVVASESDSESVVIASDSDDDSVVIASESDSEVRIE